MAWRNIRVGVEPLDSIPRMRSDSGYGSQPGERTSRVGGYPVVKQPQRVRRCQSREVFEVVQVVGPEPRRTSGFHRRPPEQGWRTFRNRKLFPSKPHACSFAGLTGRRQVSRTSSDTTGITRNGDSRRWILLAIWTGSQVPNRIEGSSRSSRLTAPRPAQINRSSIAVATRPAALPSQSGMRPGRGQLPESASSNARGSGRVVADQPARSPLDRDRALGVLAQRQAGHAEDASSPPACRRSRSAPPRRRPSARDCRGSRAARRSREPPGASRRAARARSADPRRASAGAPGRRAAGPPPAPPARRAAGPAWPGRPRSTAGAASPGRSRRGVEPERSAASSCRARSAELSASVSIITLPTSRTFAAAIPSRRRLAIAARLGHEQQVGDRVGHEPVDLLRHRPVEAAEAGLDVRHRDPQLHRRQRAGDGRVDVAEHDRRVGPASPAGAPRSARGCARSARRATPSPPRGARRAAGSELLEEHLGSCRGRSAGRCGRSRTPSRPLRAQRAHHRRELHEVGPGAGDEVSDVGAMASIGTAGAGTSNGRPSRRLRTARMEASVTARSSRHGDGPDARPDPVGERPDLRLVPLVLPSESVRRVLPLEQVTTSRKSSITATATAEDLDALLGKRLVAAGQVPMLETEPLAWRRVMKHWSSRDWRRVDAADRLGEHADRRRAREERREVDGVAGLADDAPAADVFVLGPVVRREWRRR